MDDARELGEQIDERSEVNMDKITTLSNIYHISVSVETFSTYVTVMILNTSVNHHMP